MDQPTRFWCVVSIRFGCVTAVGEMVLVEMTFNWDSQLSQS